MNNEVLIVSSIKELMSYGYIPENVNKEFVYECLTFLLKEMGIRGYGSLHYWMYAPPKPPIITPKKPTWILKIKGMELTINDLK